MRGIVVCGVFIAMCIILVSVPVVSAGGPVCPPPMCAPPPCPPPMCPPPMCAQPTGARPHPLATVLSGALRAVTGVIALPFRVVDSVIDHLRCGPRFCPPSTAMCPPPVCGPSGGPIPAMGYGMMPPPRPFGTGRGVPRRYSPMAKETVLPIMLYATPGEGFFGTFW